MNSDTLDLLKVLVVPFGLAIIGIVGVQLKSRADRRNAADGKALPTFSETWAENRNLRSEIDSLRSDFEDFRGIVGRKVDALGRGFDAAYRLAERRAHCKFGEVMPEPDESDAADINAALAIRKGGYQ